MQVIERGLLCSCLLRECVSPWVICVCGTDLKLALSNTYLITYQETMKRWTFRKPRFLEENSKVSPVFCSVMCIINLFVICCFLLSWKIYGILIKMLPQPVKKMSSLYLGPPWPIYSLGPFRLTPNTTHFFDNCFVQSIQMLSIEIPCLF